MTYIARRCLRTAQSTSSARASSLRHLAVNVHKYRGDEVLHSVRPVLSRAYDLLEIEMP